MRRAPGIAAASSSENGSGNVASSAAGTAERQGWVAELADEGVFGSRGTKGFARSADWRTEADRILARGKGRNGEG